MQCPDCGDLRHLGPCNSPLPDLLDEAIMAFQQVMMEHPDSSEHSVAVHRACSSIRLKLVKFKQHYF